MPIEQKHALSPKINFVDFYNSSIYLSLSISINAIKNVNKRPLQWVHTLSLGSLTDKADYRFQLPFIDEDDKVNTPRSMSPPNIPREEEEGGGVSV